MNLKSICLLSIAGVLALTSSLAFASETSVQAEYEKILLNREEAPKFSKKKIDVETRKLLEIAMRDWKALPSEAPDEVFQKIADLTGMKATVEGVVAFYTHEIPPFSPEDHSRNAREAVIATAQTAALPKSIDNLVHMAKGIAFVKVSNCCFEVFEDTDEGLRRTIYYQKPQGGGVPRAK